MKKSIYLCSLLVLFSLCIVSCGDSDDDVSDPKGTKSFTLIIGEDDTWGIFGGDFEGELPDTHLLDHLSYSRWTLYMAREYGFSVYGVGKKNRLGEINTIPQDSFSESASLIAILVEEGLGFIFKYNDDETETYMRLIISKVEEREDKIYIEVKYQYPFVP